MLPIEMDQTHGAVRATTEIAAAPDEVFDALTDPEQLALWWGSEDTYRTADWEVDARPGGRWSARTIDGDGVEGRIEGEYLLVDPPRRLEYTWRVNGDDGAPTTVRVDLAPVRVRGVAGTRVTVTHGGFTGATCSLRGAELYEDVWARSLARLAAPAAVGIHEYAYVAVARAA